MRPSAVRSTLFAALVRAGLITMNRGISNLRYIFHGIKTSRFLLPIRTLNSTSRDCSLVQCPRVPVLPPRPLSSYGSYRTGKPICSPNRNIYVLATTNPWICRTQPPQKSSCSLLTVKCPSVIHGRRNKTTKRRAGKSGYTKDKAESKQREEEQFTDEDGSDDDFELESGSDFRDMRVKVPSVRMDAVFKAGLNMPRSKVETAFYASKLRVNGEKVLKKSKKVYEGDELDLIKGVSSLNSDFLDISRIVILRVGMYDEDSDKYVVKLRKYPQVLIPKFSGFESEVGDSKEPL